MKKIKVNIVREADGGYCASVDDLGVYTQGDTLDDLIVNLQEAISMTDEYAGKSVQPNFYNTMELTI